MDQLSLSNHSSFFLNEQVAHWILSSQFTYKCVVGSLTLNILHLRIGNNDLIITIGIFAYLNYLTPKTRWEIIEILIKGLQRLEYRGYDSAGSVFFLLIS